MEKKSKYNYQANLKRGRYINYYQNEKKERKGVLEALKQ